MRTMDSTGVTIIISAWCVATSMTQIMTRSKMMTEIVRLAQDSYDDLKTAPPFYDKAADPARIQVLLYVTSIDAVNEVSMDFTVGILLHLKWLDERLYHDKAQVFFRDSNVEYLDFDTKNIKNVWVPDIFFPNEKKGYFHDVMTSNQMMILHKDGSILYISRLSLTLSCPMDLRNYPFDKQKCYIFIMSFGYSQEDIVFEWVNETQQSQAELFTQSSPVVMNEEVVLPQFEIKQYRPDVCNKRYHQKLGNHSCIQVEFHLARNIGFYIVQMYIPSMLIVMLSWISFWLNANSVPGRVSLGLLTVLTMTTQSSSVNAALPRVSYTKAIDVWMSTCLVFVFAALLEFAVVNVLSRKESIDGISLKNILTAPMGDGEKEKGPPALCEMTAPLDGYKDAEKRKRFGKKGIVYAVYVDVAARIFFPFCFVLFIIIYWGYYGSQPDI